MSNTQCFSEYNFPHALAMAVQQQGFEKPTPVQARSIQPLLDGQDVLAQAQTGTGKTAAFVLPTLARLSYEQTTPEVLVITPTRELAMQVADVYRDFSPKDRRTTVATICGGRDYREQLKALKGGCQVVVGTPGRLLDHLQRGTLNLSALSTVVLDEADEMLKMGFVEAIEEILACITCPHQTALFSATMPPRIRSIAKRYMNNATEITIKAKAEQAANIEQSVICISEKNKFALLVAYLEAESVESAIIFARTKQATTDISEQLLQLGYNVAALNGDMKQFVRSKTISRFKQAKINLLVATDVAARGIDVDNLSHVINFDAPYDSESYIHRIGRTGRAGRSGKAILFVTPGEGQILRNIERATSQEIKRVDPPSPKQVQQKQRDAMAEKIQAVLAEGGSESARQFLQTVSSKHNLAIKDIAVALFTMLEQNGRSEFEFAELKAEKLMSPRKPMQRRFGGRGGRHEGRSEGKRFQRRDNNDRNGRGDRGFRGDRKKRNVQ